MSLFFDRKTLEAIRDIIRETMLGNVAIVLLINISPDYMVQKNSPSIIMLSVFILICIELWMLLSVINYLSALRIRRAKLALIIFILWMCLILALTIRYFIMFSDAWSNQ
ncbi:putative membrane protein [Escherichia coli MP020980.2]|nr:putative membrane protein [Escherichia coli MP020980.2]END57190.1 putative membrane protein [Escherichia coli MP020980.1]MJP31586.1 hypothetical protein [Escherichia coli]